MISSGQTDITVPPMHVNVRKIADEQMEPETLEKPVGEDIESPPILSEIVEPKSALIEKIEGTINGIRINVRIFREPSPISEE